ncbi:hypothetical protein ASG89_21940 [Paenibacillus sp. Soil766]|uniref:fibronectin type III domain-containing protein n=1 Tax=Paenibacillus sp. Soil766 TaxID=1736404 RepID=UPI00070EF6DE|nr:carboxypeptidase regulatory-like domain-containing protein [Paenibacillus sp. Soil766]KRF04509.1 hypothetical protein ASG89_21940 [Paenibacillus sp. Soil766]
MRYLLKKLLAVYLILNLLAFMLPDFPGTVKVVHADSPSWSSVGLSSPNDVTTLLNVNGTLFAGTDGTGIWSYSNGTWTKMSGSPDRVQELENVDGTLYAGSYGYGSLWSYSNGTWTQVNDSPYSMKALENVNGTLYTGTYDYGVLSYKNDEWAQMSGSPSKVYTLLNVGDTLYAGAYGMGQDNGMPGGVWSYSSGTWTQMSGSPDGVITLLNLKGTLYAGTDVNGIWSYSNGTWTKMSGSPDRVEVLENVDGTLYAGAYGYGIWSYSNGGWTRLSGSPSKVFSLLNVNGTLYAGGPGGVVQLTISSSSTPVNLNASSTTSVSTTLTWNAVPGADVYNIYMNGSNTAIATVTNTTYTVSGLTSNSKYTFTMTASNGADSDQSGAINVLTTPNNPTGLKETDGDKQVMLAWSPVSGTETVNYSIYEGTAPGSYGTTPIAMVTGSTFTATGLANGITYYFAVKASNEGGSSDYSNEVSVTLPQPVPSDPGHANSPTWSSVGLSSPDIVNSLLDVNGTLHAGASDGIWSYNNGTWTKISGSLYNANHSLLDVNGTLYEGGGNDGVWSYSNGTWTQMSGSPPYVNSLLNVNGTLYAGAYGMGQEYMPGGVWSNNNGTWTKMSGSPFMVNSLLNANGTLYAGTFNGINDVWSYRNGKWTQVSGSPPYVRTLLNVNGTLYAGTYGSGSGHDLAGGIWSYNNGTWTQMSGSPGNVQALENVDGTLYAGTEESGIWSYNNGTWAQMSGSPSYVRSLLNTNGMLYAGGLEGVVQLLYLHSAVTTLTWDAVPGATVYNIYQGTTAIATVTSPIYTVNGLTPNTTYTFRVSAFDGTESDQSGAINVLTIPNDPTGLTATAGDEQVTLAWSPVSGTETVNFSIYEGTAPGSYGTGPVATVTGSTFTATGLANGTRYYFVVKASNAGGSSDYSNEVSVTPQPNSSVIYNSRSVFVSASQDPSIGKWTDTGFDISAGSLITISSNGSGMFTPGGSTNPDGYFYSSSGGITTQQKMDSNAFAPSAPIGALLGAVNSGSGHIGATFLVGSSYNWTATENGRLLLAYNDDPGAYGNNLGGYEVTIQGPVASPIKGTVSGKVTNTNHLPVQGAQVEINGNVYAMTDAEGNYNISNLDASTYTLYVTANGYTTQSKGNVTVTDGQTTTVDFTMASLQLTNLKASSTTLTWDAVPGATVYNIYQGTTAIATVTSPIYTVDGLTPNTTYTFRVSAFNGTESDQSGAINVLTIPNNPTGLTATAGDEQVKLAWSPVSGSGERVTYNVFVGTASGSYGTTPVATVTDSTYYMATGLVNGTGYYFAVKANNGGGSSDYSNEVSVTPQPNLSVSYNGNNATTGKVPIDNNFYTPGVTVPVYDNIGNLAKSGYTFAGWNTSADGSGMSYSPGASITMSAANLTLYAKWLPKGIISGRVTDSGNKPIQDALVFANQGPDQWGNAVTDVEGNYTISDLDANNYRVRVVVEGYTEQWKDIVVTAGQTTTADFTIDSEAPRVISINPAESSMLPANPVINVLALDNYKLSKVTIEYQKVGAQADQWNALGTKDLDVSSDVVSLVWNTSSLISGTYKLRTSAYDQAGNKSAPINVTYGLDVDPPTTPIVTTSPGGWKVDLSWTSGNETDLAGFRVYKSLTPGGPYSLLTETMLTLYTDVPLSPGSDYYYKVEAVDRYHNASMSVETAASPLSQDPFAPEAKAGNDRTATAGAEVAFDGTRSKDNDRVAAYLWDLGDGTISNLSQPTHIYASAGSYTVTLTVTDPSGNTASDTMILTVYPGQQVGSLQVRVIDSDTGAVIPGANVYVNFPDNVPKNFITDGNGMATVVAIPGKYGVSAYKTGYLPAEVMSEVKQYQGTQVTVRIKKAKLVVGDLNVHRMSLEEIVAEGIDVNAPENQHVFKFEVHLTFAQQPLPVEYIILNGYGNILGGSGPISYGGVGGNGSVGYAYPKAIAYENHPEIPPTLAFLTIPKEVSWLKEFFEVGLSMYNMADPQFVIADSAATLKLPDGLTLAPTEEEQSPTIHIGDIAGQETKEVKWIVRGDKKGSYNLEADFNGALMPFSAPVSTTFKTSEPLRVWGGDALHIYVEAEDSAYIGELYYAQFRITNESDIPIYNLKTNFGAYSEPTTVHEVVIIDPDGNKKKERYEGGASFYITSIDAQKSLPFLQTGDSVGVGVLNPGESLYGTYVTNFSAVGDRDEVYYRLKEAFSVTSGDSTTEVPVTITTIPSHVTKYKIQYIDDGSLWGDPVDTTNGAYVLEREALSAFGSNVVPFSLRYNSLLLNEGQLGKGWSHNYETRLELQEDGTIGVRWSASSYTQFFSKDAIEGKVHGSKRADGAILLANEQGMVEQEYYSKTLNANDNALKRHADGTYTLTFGDQNTYFFDPSGNLTKMLDRNGGTVTVTNMEGKLLITEPQSGQTLTVKFNALGLVESVSDQLGRSVNFHYDSTHMLTEITDANGKATTYTYDSEGRVLTETSAEGVIFLTNTYDSKGRVVTQDDGVEGNLLTLYSYDDTSESWEITVTITDRNGNTRKHKSNRYGQLLMIEDELGHRTTYTYDGNGNRTSLTDSNGNTATYTYDGMGHLLAVTDAEGRATTMTYDTNGNLLTVENAIGERTTNTYNSKNSLMSSVDERGITTVYTYTEYGQLLSKTVDGVGTISYYYENGRLISISDYLGNTTTFGYDSAGRVISITDREGKKTLYEYDAAGNELSRTNSAGHKTSYTYDSRGNVLTETDQRGNTTRFTYNGNRKMIEAIDPKGNKTFSEYDGEDRLTTVTNASGNTSGSTYDAAGRVVTTIDALGNVTTLTYDNTGNLLSKTTADQGTVGYAYYKNGKLKKVTDAAGGETFYDYDAAWRISKITNAAGKSSTFTYDSAGNLLSVKDPLENQISYTYDNSGNRITMTDARGNTTRYTYNANGKMTSITDALNYISEYNYDNEGRLTKITNAKGNSQTMAYDDSGNLVSITDALGHAVTMEYDAVGSPVKLKDAYGNEIQSTTYDSTNLPVLVEDAFDNQVINHYDKVGRLIESIDAMNRSTKYVYDKVNRLVSTVDELGGESKQTFDANGNQRTLTNPNENTTTYGFDVAGRLVSETMAIGITKTYGYNALNLMASMKNGRGQETTHKYDDAERLINFSDPVGNVAYTYDPNGNVLTVSDGKGTITREYDELNRVVKYTDSKGNTTKYSYDTVGNLATLTYPDGKDVNYEYDEADRLVKVTDWDNRITRYEYDHNGRLTKTVNANGSVLTQSYDAMGRILRQKEIDAKGNVINQNDYSYNSIGNITVEESSNDPQPITMNNAVMTYDKNNRLITFNGQTVKYDADGNMTYGPLNGVMVNFHYDSRNRLIEAGNTTYEYDAENNRIAVIDNDERIEFINNPQPELSQVLAMKDAKGNATWFVYGIGLIGHQETSGAFSTYHYDVRGSTTAITDDTGMVTDRFTYTTYGELIERTGTTSTPFLYSGRDGIMTDDTGLYYMRARYYNPEIKRFMNQDIIQGSILDGRSLNRYAYVNGDPVNNIDPSGQVPIVIGVAVVGGVSGAAEKYFSDVVQNVSDGKKGWSILKPSSSWKEYTVSTLGGATTAVITRSIGPIGSIFKNELVGRFANKLVDSTVDNSVKKIMGEEVTWTDVVKDTVVGTFITVKIKGVNDGKVNKVNNWLGSYNSVINNKNNKNISVKTIAKGFGGNLPDTLTRGISEVILSWDE